MNRIVLRLHLVPLPIAVVARQGRVFSRGRGIHRVAVTSHHSGTVRLPRDCFLWRSCHAGRDHHVSPDGPLNLIQGPPCCSCQSLFHAEGDHPLLAPWLESQYLGHGSTPILSLRPGRGKKTSINPRSRWRRDISKGSPRCPSGADMSEPASSLRVPG